MPSMSLRLDELDHDLLRLLVIVKHQSANQIITDLLHAEFERELPGKRDGVRFAPGSGLERMRRALDLPALVDDPAADAALTTALSRANAEADRIYGDGEQVAAA